MSACSWIDNGVPKHNLGSGHDEAVYSAVEVTGESHLHDLVGHADRRDWQISAFVSLAVDHTDELVVVPEQFAFEGVVEGEGNPLLFGEFADVQNPR